ncbi:hypothetical protein ACFY97_18600 [Streptomyces klenkii]|uniref:hypothetical protein n=1 Tax=Streptomyces klenkii TaxID=1420899 RepID=UPI0036E1E4B1
MGEDTLFRSLDLIEPGDLVRYHGSLTDAHGLYLAQPCPCAVCRLRLRITPTDTRYVLLDPWDEMPGPQCVRRASITRSDACN